MSDEQNHTSHLNSPRPLSCEACYAVWLALRSGPTPTGEVPPERPRPDLEGNVERPRDWRNAGELF